MPKNSHLFGFMIFMAAAWGLTVPLSKYVVDSGHKPFGLIFWQLVIIGTALGITNTVRGRKLPWSLWHLRLYAIVATFGIILPDIGFYVALQQLPAGIVAVIMTSVPLFALPLAVALGKDRVSFLRVLGLGFGAAGVVLLVGPENSLPPEVSVLFVATAFLIPLSYAVEGNLVDLWGSLDLDAPQTLLGATIVAFVTITPISFLSGQWINPVENFGLPEIAFVSSALLHAVAYTGYVWLISRAGAVFAGQTSYLVDGFGVVWSMLLLGEWYSNWVWAALALIVVGMLMVQPRKA